MSNPMILYDSYAMIKFLKFHVNPPNNALGGECVRELNCIWCAPNVKFSPSLPTIFGNLSSPNKIVHNLEGTTLKFRLPSHVYKLQTWPVPLMWRELAK